MLAFLNKLTRKGTWRQVFICLSTLNPSPSPCPCYTLYEGKCTPVLIHTGKGGRGGGVDEPVRRLEGRFFTRALENTDVTVCISSL
jgi:hypothetical protein